MEEFHVHFKKTDQAYDVTFREQQNASPDTVLIDGRNYKLEGEREKITWLKEKLQLSSDSSISRVTLKESLVSLNVSNPTISKLVHSVGISTLDVTKNLSPEDLKRWKAVRERFGAFTKRLEETIPEGRAAHITLVMPPVVEKIIGPLTFSKGTTGSKLSHGREIDQHTLTNIGSSTKPMTGLLAAVMENQGFLRFSDSITRFFPKEVMDNFQPYLSFDDSVKIDPADITVETLASMTGGLTYSGDCGVKQDEIDPLSTPLDSILRDHFTRESIPFVGRPGDRLWSYSNQIQLTAYVIEKAFKEKFVQNLFQNNEMLGNRKLESFFKDVSSSVRVTIEKLPENIKNMSLNKLIEICRDQSRNDAYVEGMYLYDLLDVVIAAESPGDEQLAFADALNRELLVPLGITEATYTPEKTSLLEEDRVLTNPGTGQIAKPSVLRQGCGALYIHAADETQFVRALMQPALHASDGRCLVTEKQMETFIESKGDNVAIGTGGLGFRERSASVTVEKGGSIDSYHHQFQCERPKDSLRENEAVGIIMSNNFLGSDQEFEQIYKELYEEVVTTLLGPSESKEPPTIPKPGSTTILPPGKGQVKDAERLFKGARGLFAYSTGKFLNWSGTPYKIHTSDDGQREYIFHKGKPLEVRLYKKEGFSYLGLGADFIASQIKDRSKFLEAEETTQASKDLIDAKTVFSRLVGVYDGDHPQGHRDLRITQDPPGTLCLDHHQEGGGASRLQIVSIIRDKESNEITGIQMTGTFREPPDMMLNFKKNTEGSWVFHIADFVDPSTEFEKCSKRLTKAKVTDVAQKSSGVYSEVEPGKIFLFTGSSTAGKSSIINLFSKDTGAVPLGLDEYVITFFQKQYPREYKILTKVVDRTEVLEPIFTGKLPENASGTVSERKEAEMCIDNLRADGFTPPRFFEKELFPDHFKTILETAKGGSTVVLDTTQTELFFEFLSENRYSEKVTHFIIYLPVEKLVERVKERNQDPKNYRSIGGVLHDFIRLYKQKEPNSTAPVVGTIQRATVEKLYREVEDSLQEEREKGFRLYSKDEFLDHFGLDEGADEVEITSALPVRFNGIFSTAVLKTPEIVNQIKNHSWQIIG